MDSRAGDDLQSPGVYYYLPPLFFAMDTDPGEMTNMSHETSLPTKGCSHLAHFLPLEGQRPMASGDVGWGVLCNNTCTRTMDSPPQISFPQHPRNQ